ncbi:MAG: GntR family transcriptional regulator [Chlamydiia bacterium]|nr:GntR family transcriptional regulator [Chlamydiia bacterium]
MSVEERLLDDLCSGVYAPGEKLNISELVKRYGVGLAPLREALARLTASGLVRYASNRGYQVEPVSLQDLSDVQAALLPIELLALRQAMERGGEAWELGVVSALYRLEKIENAKQPPGFEDWAAANSAFHNALVAASGGLTLELRRLITLRMRRYTRLGFEAVQGRLEVNYQDHKALADAALGRMTEEACVLLERHFMEGNRDIMELLKGKLK